MACYLEKVILITLLLTITIPISRSQKEKEASHKKEDYLRDLCSKTHRPELCRKILKTELHRFKNLDDQTVAGAVIDMAIAKSRKISEKLIEYYSGSTIEELKEKYSSCSINYDAININLSVAREELKIRYSRGITAEVKRSREHLNKCKQVFEKSFDPGHVWLESNKFELYLEIIRAAHI